MNEIKQPHLASRFLRWICPDHLLEEIEGDLTQRFNRDLKIFGETRARRKLLWNTIRFLRPGIILRNKFSFNLNPFYMLSHFFRIFFRTSLKNGVYSVINISGLAIGLTCCIFILLWVMDETTFDQFHKDRDRICQVMVNHTFPDGVFTYDNTSGRLAEGLKELPEVEESCRINFFGGRVLFAIKNKTIYEDGIFADASVFRIFTLPVIQGNPDVCLDDKNSIVISEKLAARYFKGEDAVGKLIRINNDRDARVTAVFRDLPENSSLRFEFILPYAQYAEGDQYNKEWGAWTGGLTYVKLHPGTDAYSLNHKITKTITEPRIWPRWDSSVELFLFPMSDWRLHNNFVNGKSSGGRITYVRIFVAVGVFVLLIACVNFMNLATARAVSRSKEIGVRKVVGAQRASLIRQFIGESVMISVFSLLLSLLVVHILLPSFNDLTGKNLTIDYFAPAIYGSLLAISLTTGLLAGSYPAFFLSSLRAIHVLKGTVSALSGSGIRKGLVVFQFGLSVILIISALVVYRQIDYMRNRNLGFDRENILYFEKSEGIRRNFEGFRNALLMNPLIQSVGRSNSNPMDIGTGIVLADNAWPGKAKEDNVNFRYLQVDHDFLTTMGFTFADGRNFSRGTVSDSVNYIVSEEAARRMKLSDPLGQELVAPKPGKIVGVVKDFNSLALQAPLQPVIIAMRPQNTDRVFIRYESGKLEQALTHIQKLYKKFDPDFPLELSFMDETFGRQYQSEIVSGKLSAWFTAIAIFISCLGLFGLTSFTAERRSKEISLRKVLGATVSQVVVLLCREFVLLIVIALAIGIPIAWWMSEQYLQTYAFRTDLSVEIFIITASSIVLVALLTVSFQSFRAAIMNPVKNLRNE